MLDVYCAVGQVRNLSQFVEERRQERKRRERRGLVDRRLGWELGEADLIEMVRRRFRGEVRP